LNNTTLRDRKRGKEKKRKRKRESERKVAHKKSNME